MIEFNKKNIVITAFYALVSLTLLLLSYLSVGLQYQESIYRIGVIIIIQIIINLIAFNEMDISPLSLSGLFVWLNYLFHLAQPIVKVIAPDYKLAFDVSLYVPEQVYYESLHYSLLIILALVLGVMLYKSIEFDTSNDSRRDYKLSNISQTNLLIMGTVILAFTLPVEAYIQISRVFIALNEGYIATLQDGIGGITAFLANFSIVGVIMLIIGSKKNQRRGTIILVLYTLFYIGTMFSGGRMWQIIKITLVLYYYLRTYDISIKGKNLVIFGVLGYILAGFLGAVGNFRSYNFNDTSYVFEIIRDVFINNPILEVLDEFGGTVYTLSLVIDQTPQKIAYSYGSQFITNLFGILPNIGGIIEAIISRANYVFLLEMPTIGGSFIGEIYYSFHYVGVIFTFILGWIIQYITDKVDRGLRSNNYHFIIYTLMIQYSFISWVRGSSGIFYRNTTYAAVLIFIITNVLIPSEEKTKLTYHRPKQKQENSNG